MKKIAGMITDFPIRIKLFRMKNNRISIECIYLFVRIP